MADEHPVTQVYTLATQFLALNRFQQETFLVHISAAQCRIIQNVAYNLLLNTSVQSLLSEVDRKYLRRSTSALRTIASRRICVREKRAVLVKKTRLIRRILQISIKYVDQERVGSVSEDVNEE